MEQESLENYLDKLHQEKATSERSIPSLIHEQGIATWALRKIKQLETIKQENTQVAYNEIEKIKTWQQKVNTQLDQEIQSLRQHLYHYAIAQRKKDPSLKTFHLPHGQIGFRQQSPKWNYGNEQALLTALKQSGYHQFIRIKESLDKRKIKKYFSVQGEKAYDPHTGERLDGVTIDRQEETFFVKPE